MGWAALSRVGAASAALRIFGSGAGCYHSLAGDADRAIDLLEHAARHGEGSRAWLAHDGGIDPIRHLPRFEALMRGLATATPAVTSRSSS